MRVSFHSVSVDSLFLLKTCLEKRRSELALGISRLRSDLNDLKNADKTSSLEFSELLEVLEERKKEEALILGLLEQF